MGRFDPSKVMNEVYQRVFPRNWVPILRMLSGGVRCHVHCHFEGGKSGILRRLDPKVIDPCGGLEVTGVKKID